MNLIILGPHGSGNGTQASLLAVSLGLFYFESGDFLRESAKVNPRIDEIVNKKGELLPDEEVFGLITKYFEEKHPTLENFILDGYPRSLKQYEMLKNWLLGKGKKINWVIYLTLSEDESLTRITARRICEKCDRVWNLVTNPPPAPDTCECGGRLIQRQDDTPEVVKKRLEIYQETTAPLIEVFKKDGILVSVNGEQPIDTILKEIVAKVA